MKQRGFISDCLRFAVQRKLAHRAALAAQASRGYTLAPESVVERRSLQLARFNRLWQAIQVEVPFYRDEVSAGRLPKDVSSWESFVEQFPVVNRESVQSLGRTLYHSRKKADFWRITGGSTAEPVRLPAWFSERNETEANEWFARSWWGVTPADSSFRIWGHLHRLGTGWKGFVRRKSRDWKDLALGIDRFSAYDLSEVRLTEALHRYESFKASYVLGYSGALYQFAQRIKRVQGTVHHVPRIVLATSESFPDPAAREWTGGIFRAPVVMEYGSEETGLLAQTDRSGRYQVMWQSYFVELIERGAIGCKVRVTSLYPRAFPLIRYELGDELTCGSPGLGADQFDDVAGRETDFVHLPDGSLLHPRIIMHAVKECSRVAAYQLVDGGPGGFVLRLVPLGTLENRHLAEIRNRLLRTSSALSGIRLVVTVRLDQTRAGKTPLFIRR